MPSKRLYPEFPKDKSTKRTLQGGPWAKQKIGFRPDQRELVVTRADGSYVGRYVVRDVPQKNRVIVKVQWETREDKAALIRRRLRENPFIK
jgi:hypothetical protein